jgi:hypothetical protein
MSARTSCVLELKQNKPKFPLTTSGECRIIPAHSRPIQEPRSLRRLGLRASRGRTTFLCGASAQYKEYESKQTDDVSAKLWFEKSPRRYVKSNDSDESAAVSSEG